MRFGGVPKPSYRVSDVASTRELHDPHLFIEDLLRACIFLDQGPSLLATRKPKPLVCALG